MYVRSFNPNFTIIYYFPKLFNITYYKSIKFEEVPEKTKTRCSLNSNHHLVNFSHALLGRRVVSHPHREPMLLSYLLPLSRHASSQTPTDPKAFLPSQCHPTTPPKPPNPLLLAIPNQPYFYTPS